MMRAPRRQRGVVLVAFAAMLAALLLVGTHLELYLAATIGGLVWAGSIALSSAILADVYGVRLVGILYGWAFLGHQVGGGSGKDLATVGGAVAGGVIGSNVGRSGSTLGTRDVQRCESTVSGTPAYWDVTYNFRGRDHQMQMSAAPGQTIAVNRDGEPRQ